MKLEKIRRQFKIHHLAVQNLPLLGDHPGVCPQCCREIIYTEPQRARLLLFVYVLTYKPVFTTYDTTVDSSFECSS